MKIDSIQANLEDEVKNCETIKNIVLSQLLDDKIISKEDYEHYNSKWAFVLIKPSWYTRIFKDVSDPKTWRYNLVKLR